MTGWWLWTVQKKGLSNRLGEALSGLDAGHGAQSNPQNAGGVASRHTSGFVPVAFQ